MWDEQDEPQDKSELKHSGIGIASFTIAVIVAPAEYFLVILNANLAASTDESTRRRIALAVGITLGLLVTVGTVLAFCGLMQQRRQKVFPILGLISNIPLWFCTGGLTVINLILDRRR
jgi:hypothetical protein